jgi:hypothetical protein
LRIDTLPLKTLLLEINTKQNQIIINKRMRGEYFLALPVLATLVNVFFCLVILQSHHSHAHEEEEQESFAGSSFLDQECHFHS